MRANCQLQIRGLQVLRAIAACAVVYSHAHSRAARAWQSESVISPEFVLVGHAGVDLFLVLIGFLMMYLHADAFGKGIAGQFLRRRLIRIVPIY